jgi:Uma2 family endonuclease
VRNDKVPTGEAAAGFARFVPDLAVEVLSPNENFAKVGGKIREFIDNGVPLVWLVDRSRKTVTVYRSPNPAEEFKLDDPIGGEHVLPGFSCLVSKFF